MQIGRLNLRLMLERDAGEGYAALGVARVVERRADNTVRARRAVHPADATRRRAPVLDGYVRELHGLLHQRGEALGGAAVAAGARRRRRDRRLPAARDGQPLRAAVRAPAAALVLHPERCTPRASALAGDLSTFRDSGARRPIPTTATTTRSCFRAGDGRPAAVAVDGAGAERDPDRAAGARVRRARRRSSPTSTCCAPRAFVLAVDGADVPARRCACASRPQVKIGPVERIRDLVNLKLPGVALRPLPVAPRQIPYHAGFNYFELETRGNELWKQLETVGRLWRCTSPATSPDSSSSSGPSAAERG